MTIKIRLEIYDTEADSKKNYDGKLFAAHCADALFL